MRRVNVRERFDRLIAENRMPVGILVSLVDPAITATVSTAGVNIVIIDRKHAPNATNTTANRGRAAETSGQEGAALFDSMIYWSQVRAKQVANLVVAK